MSELFSPITTGVLAIAGVIDSDFCSILGGGIPDSFPNGISPPIAPDALAVRGGPASSGVRNAFSHEPGRGSPDDGAIIGGGLVTMGPCDFSIFSSAT